MIQNVFRTYSYVFFGPEKVGKTNLITRLTKDQFTEAHNMTLEGQQTTILTIDGQHFQINLHDTAGQENMVSMKAVWRSKKNGYLFVFAIDSKESFTNVVQQMEEIKRQSLYRNVASILIGNKKDLEPLREVQTSEAKQKAEELGIKYMEVSAKASLREEIQRIFHEMIDINQMQRFDENGVSEQSIVTKILSPCDKENCQLI